MNRESADRMTAAEKMAATVRDAVPSIKVGTLRFWGAWFGQPYDNWHQMTGAEADGAVLRLVFNNGEALNIWEPSALTIGQAVFRIADAIRVRWEWYSYGLAPTPQNLYFMDFLKTEDAVVATTNWPSCEPKPKLHFPAVEVL